MAQKNTTQSTLEHVRFNSLEQSQRLHEVHVRLESRMCRDDRHLLLGSWRGSLGGRVLLLLGGRVLLGR